MSTRTEPVVVGGIGAAVLTLVVAVVGLLVTFNVPVTSDQQVAIERLVVAIVGLVALVAPIVGAWCARRKVTPLWGPKLVTRSGAVIPLVPSAEVRVDDPPRHRADAGYSVLGLAALVLIVLAVLVLLLAALGRL